LRLAPASPALHNEKGGVLERTGRLAEAERSFRAAIELRPRDPRATRNLATLLLRSDRAPEAVSLLAELASAYPTDAAIRQLLGAAHARAGRYEDAVAELRRATQLDPSSAACWCNLGLALEDVSQVGEAIQALREARRLAPDWAVPRFHLAAMGEGAPPATCPPEYLVEFFDAYSVRFDRHLAGDLGYRGPEAVAAAATAARPGGFGHAFDLGCGTGLCGVLLRPQCRRLVGIDAAPKMIERATARGVYDELITGDIVETSRARAGAADLAVAADVLIYVGALEPLFAAVRALLRPGGMFVFTTELADADEAGPGGYALRRTRRYAHADRYVRQVAGASGLVVADESSLDLRRGPMAPVAGVVYSARRD
jgi:predicted TPR repeat methyltransferase